MINKNFSVGECLFRVVKLSIGKWGKDVDIFVWTIGYQVRLIIEKKDILVLGEGSTGAFDNSKIMMKATFSVKITKSKSRFVWVYTTTQPSDFLY